MQQSDNHGKTSRRGLGLLLHTTKQQYVEDSRTQSFSTTPRPYIPQLPKMSQQSLSTNNTFNNNTRKLIISADRPTTTIKEEQDSQIQQSNQLDEELQLQKVKEIYELLQNRCSTLDLLISIIGGKDFIYNLKTQTTLEKIQDLLKSISHTLTQSARTEIELAFKMREVERKNIKCSSLQLMQNKLSDKNQSLQSTIDVHSHKTSQLLDENQKMSRQLKIEQRNNQLNSKKILALEKRIEFLLENEVQHGLNPNDKLRASLNELLKENECVKRELQHKTQELERVQGKLNQYQQVVNRLQKTIDNMKKKNFEQESEKEVFKKDDIDLLINFKIPQTLDFRIVSQRLNHQHLINDIQEKGIAATTHHNFTLPIEAQKEQFALIARQFISYKEFADKLNQFFYNMDQFAKCTQFEEIIYLANRVLPSIFNCESVRLWLLDGMNGTIFTYLENRQQVRALQHKGQIADVVKLKKAQNISQASSKPLLYRIGENETADYARNALLIPIYCEGTDNAIRGILEVINTDNEFFSFDEEYFGILVSHQLTHLLQRLVDIQSWQISQKYRGMMIDAFNHLMRSESKQQFTMRVCESLSQIFGFSQVVFYFVESERLIDHSGEQAKEFNLNYGLAGLVASTRQKLIINDVKNSVHFNQAVDIKSIMPIFAQPLIDQQGRVLAVIETVLKSKLKIQIEKDQLISPSQGVLGMEEPLTKQLSSFVEMIIAALINISF